MALSILFKRPFLNREIENDSEGVSMSLRIPSLLKLFGLADRKVFSTDNRNLDELLNVDFTRRDEVLPVERDKAFKFLATALKIEPNKHSIGWGGIAVAA